MYKWGVWLDSPALRVTFVSVLSWDRSFAPRFDSHLISSLSLSRVFRSNCTWKSWMCISRRCLICSLYQKVVGQRNSGEKFHVSILIMHRPSLQLHTWLISFSLLNSFPLTFMTFALFGRENFIHDNCFKPRQQFEDREQYVYFHFSIWLHRFPPLHCLFLLIFLLSIFHLFLLCLLLNFSYFFVFLSREQYLYFELVLLLPSFLPSLQYVVYSFFCLFAKLFILVNCCYFPCILFVLQFVCFIFSFF